jgi:hypothetical protein
MPKSYGAIARGGRPRAPRKAAAPQSLRLAGLPRGPKGPPVGTLAALTGSRVPWATPEATPTVSRGYPPPPDTWQDDEAAWAIYWAHRPLGRGPVGQSWFYRTPYGGSFGVAGFVPDFLEVDLDVVIDVFGRVEQSEADPRAIIALRTAILAHLGALYVVIDEEIALADPISALRRALIGLPSSVYM